MTIEERKQRILDKIAQMQAEGKDKKLETVALQTSRVKAPDSSETPTL